MFSVTRGLCNRAKYTTKISFLAHEFIQNFSWGLCLETNRKYLSSAWLIARLINYMFGKRTEANIKMTETNVHSTTNGNKIENAILPGSWMT